MSKSKIEWCDMVWNPVTGCTKISEGCQNCYAEKFANRMKYHSNFKVAKKYHYGFKVWEHQEELYNKDWMKPGRKQLKIFVCSMGDMFHGEIDFNFIYRVLKVIKNNPQHIFMILTKRPDRLLEFYNWVNYNYSAWFEIIPNLWLGVTAENQKWYDTRVPLLLEVPSKIHFVSCEPMLGTIQLTQFSLLSKYSHLDWVICGGETGAGARLTSHSWFDSLLSECKTYYIPFYFKGKGTHLLSKNSVIYNDIDGKEYREYPIV